MRRHGTAIIALLYQFIAQHLPDGPPADRPEFGRDLPPDSAQRLQVSAQTWRRGASVPPSPQPPPPKSDYNCLLTRRTRRTLRQQMRRAGLLERQRRADGVPRLHNSAQYFCQRCAGGDRRECVQDV